MLPINLQVMFSVVKDINYSTRQINKFKIKYVRTQMKSMAEIYGCISYRGKTLELIRSRI